MSMETLKASIDILRVFTITLGSMVIRPSRIKTRAWSTEFTFRLAKRLINESVDKPIPWLRQRQNLLKMVTPEMCQIRQHQQNIAGVPCRIITPKKLPSHQRTILYIHGGGYCVGSSASYLSTCAKLAIKCEAEVIAIDYRLCPEHPIPVAQDDCLKVAQHCIEHKQGKDIILMGDSAGGGLCLHTVSALSNSCFLNTCFQRTGRQGAALQEAIKACVLISPWLEPLDSAHLEHANQESDILDAQITDHWKKHLNNDLKNDSEVLTQALCFSNVGASLTKTQLPKLYIQAAGAEVFIKQIRAFLETLKSENHEFVYDEFEGQFHVFQTLAPLVREADPALNKIADFVQGL